MIFSAYQINLTTCELSNKESLNENELNGFMTEAYSKFGAVFVVEEISGNSILYIDNGEDFVAHSRFKGKEETERFLQEK